MTAALTLLLPLLLGAAQASELHVEAPITLVVRINGMALDYEVGASVVVARNLKPGEFQVEVQNAFGKTKAQSLVSIGQDEVVRLAYSKKALVERGRGPMPPGGTPPQGIEPALRQAAEAVERVATDVAQELEEATQEVIEAVDPKTAPAEAPPAEPPPAEPPPAEPPPTAAPSDAP
jgi:hypothetical protein